jgi:hypothetical protein
MFRKYVAIPSEQMDTQMSETQQSTDSPAIINNEKKRQQRSTIDRLTRILKIILKLASVKGYDEILRVKRDDESYVENSNIISLLNHSMSHGRLLTGLPEFIKLLYDARIDPDLIINENVRAKLYGYINQNKSVTLDAETNTLNNQLDATTVTDSINKNDASTDPINNIIDVSTSTEQSQPVQQMLGKRSFENLPKTIDFNGPPKSKHRKKEKNSPFVWELIENTPEIKPWEVNLPDDDSDF